jgi:starch synthase/alpha-amylase
MSNFAAPPRILLVTPAAVFMPEKDGNQTNFILTNAGGFGDFPAELISALFHLGVDVHVAQPDYRRIFAISTHNEQTSAGIKLPIDRIHFAEDRAFFYAKPLNSNYEWENLKISLVFQREVINQIIPRVQPDLIHCCDWMTGLIPAAAKNSEIPCLFTVQKLDSARSILARVEDIGIDAAGFWQNLFYDKYPGSYEETRDTNPLDLLLSGILAANQVNTTEPELLPGIVEGRGNLKYSSPGQVLAQKWQAGCACEIPGSRHLGLNPTINKKRSQRQPVSSSENWTTAKRYIDLYETMLQRPLVALESNVHPINKNSHRKASGARAIAYPEARHTRSHPLSNKRNFTPAMVPDSKRARTAGAVTL